jgi:hypothetical protein
MNTLLVRLSVVVALAAQAACHRHIEVGVDRLPELAAAPGRRPQAVIEGDTIDGTTPLIVRTEDGAEHRVSPFLFHLGEHQLVAPDDGVLVQRSELASVSVRLVSGPRTAALIGAMALLGIGAFTFLTLTAGQARLEAR